jgi:uncharacterized membrane protein (UPF0127 family)
LRHLLWAGLLALAAPLAPVAAQDFASAQKLATQPLTIRSGKVLHRFQVEVARTGREQAIGLMFRRSMAADHGMIFIRKPADVASFWMKNTFIPLDLLFIRADGTISSIAPDAVPQSLAPIEAVEPVVAVLELKGGEAARRGIKPGDVVKW